MIAWRKQKGNSNKQSFLQRGEKQNNANMEISIKCFKCRKPGHKAVDCPQNVKRHIAKSVKEPEDYIAYEEKREITFKTTTGGQDSRWCLDSGSTSHVCYNEGMAYS